MTDPIDHITADAVVTADGQSHDADVLILATGFKVMDTDSITYPVTGVGRASHWSTTGTPTGCRPTRV